MELNKLELVLGAIIVLAIIVCITAYQIALLFVHKG